MEAGEGRRETRFRPVDLPMPNEAGRRRGRRHNRFFAMTAPLASVPASAPTTLLTPDHTVLSRAGGRFRIRPVRRSDETALRDMFLRCSADDLRLRCFGLSKSFPADFAARLARLTRPDEFAIAAATEAGEMAGVVHAVALPGTEGDADYDIMVRTDLKGQGLGSLLMREMLKQAVRSGFRAVHGDVLMSNRAMLLLAGDLGFRRVALQDGVVRLTALPCGGAESRAGPSGR